MSFPEKVANEALAFCGRCCCICHKFCGKKIELHHIKQKAYGGEDTLENCIPLCFDCHSEMGKADPKHPKGKCYTECELKKHRDNWYKKIENDHHQYNEEDISSADIELFNSICEVFTDKVRCYLADVDIGGMHPFFAFETLTELLNKNNDPFFEFLNCELEKLKGNLISSIREFMNYKSINTFPRDICGQNCFVTRQWMVNHEDWVPKNMKYEEYYKLFKGEAKKLNDLASEVWSSYNEFVRQGRRLLKT